MIAAPIDWSTEADFAEPTFWHHSVYGWAVVDGAGRRLRRLTEAEEVLARKLSDEAQEPLAELPDVATAAKVPHVTTPALPVAGTGEGHRLGGGGRVLALVPPEPGSVAEVTARNEAAGLCLGLAPPNPRRGALLRMAGRHG